MSTRPAAERSHSSLAAPDSGFWLTVILVITLVIAWRTAYFAMGDLADGHAATLPRRLIEETSGAVSALVLLPFVVAFIRRFPPRPPWLSTIAIHGAALAVFSVCHTLLIAVARAVLFGAVMRVPYHYGDLPLRMLQEAPNDIVVYGVLVSALLVRDARQRRRAREEGYRQLQEAGERERLALERELAQSELANLQLQLQPHFLFNALNTISARMYDDPAAADEMIDHLSDLLRHALRTVGTHEVPLRDELGLLASYVALAQARFGERLSVALDIAPETMPALVPPLLLQPLLENAIQHGVLPSAAGEVRVTTRVVDHAGPRLRIEVSNATPEAASETSAGGLGMGLTVTRRRLTLLHGSDAALRCEQRPGEYHVHVELPFRAEPAPRTSASAALALAP